MNRTIKDLGLHGCKNVTSGDVIRAAMAVGMTTLSAIAVGNPR